MRKVLGILTEDFRLYHDLVAALKARDLPFTSLSFARRIPDAVGAVLTSPAEASRVRLRHDMPKADPARLGRRRQDGPDGVRDSTSERQTREGKVARLQSGDEIVIESEVFGEDSQDLSHRPTTKPGAGS